MFRERNRMFHDRRQAGQVLAAELEAYRDADPVIVGLPRGGVVVADEVATALGARLDIIVVRKVGAPSQPELALGAVGEGGLAVWNRDVVRFTRLRDDRLAALAEAAAKEVDDRVQRFRAGRGALSLADQTVIIVDDGLATGATARAAAQVARAQGASTVVIAVPVGAPTTIAALAGVADRVVAVEAPTDLQAVGLWYRDFTQVTDAEVIEVLSSRAQD